MRKQRFLILPVLTVFVSLSIGQEKFSPGSQFFERVRMALEKKETTAYQHKTEIDEEKGSYLCDCSGLIGYLLRADFPEAYAALDGKEAEWRKRPLAVTYYETFLRAEREGSPFWEVVPRLADARPGDIVSWRNITVKKGTSTGHVAVIASVPMQEADGQFRIVVIDSTSHPHSDDTRPEGADGLGRGTMWFSVDEQGKPNRYYHEKNGYPGKSTMLVIGRLKGR